MTFPNKVSTPDPWIQGSLKSVCNLLPVLAQTTPFHILFVAAKMYYFYYSPPLILTLPSLVFCAFAHAIHHVYNRHFFSLFPLLYICLLKSHDSFKDKLGAVCSTELSLIPSTPSWMWSFPSTNFSQHAAETSPLCFTHICLNVIFGPFNCECLATVWHIYLWY